MALAGFGWLWLALVARMAQVARIGDPKHGIANGKGRQAGLPLVTLAALAEPRG